MVMVSVKRNTSWMKSNNESHCSCTPEYLLVPKYEFWCSSVYFPTKGKKSVSPEQFSE